MRVNKWWQEREVIRVQKFEIFSEMAHRSSPIPTVYVHALYTGNFRYSICAFYRR